MPELPDRPNLDQLRRQARELLRAAAGGEPSALSRIRVYSERVSLSTAQLTLARAKHRLDPADLERHCAATLARAAEIQPGGQPRAPELSRLCDFLTGRGPAGALPPHWAAMISAVDLVDGARRHLDISAALPPVDGVVVQVDTLVSEPDSWTVHLRAEPGWWAYNADGDSKMAAMVASAEDDLGGRYLSQFGGSSGHGDHEELALRFLPRLNPLARALTLTFSRAAQQATIELRLPDGDERP